MNVGHLQDLLDHGQVQRARELDPPVLSGRDDKHGTVRDRLGQQPRHIRTDQRQDLTLTLSHVDLVTAVLGQKILCMEPRTGTQRVVPVKHNNSPLPDRVGHGWGRGCG